MSRVQSFPTSNPIPLSNISNSSARRSIEQPHDATATTTSRYTPNPPPTVSPPPIPSSITAIPVQNSPTSQAGQLAVIPQTQPPNANTQSSHGQQISLPSFQRPTKKWWSEFWNAANGVGVTALVIATVFGVGAWVGMNMQIKQGSQSLELTIWATCADHASIQNTTLCQNILSKPFDQFSQRSVDVSIDTADVVVSKRSSVDILSENDSPIHKASPMENLISGLNVHEADLITGRTNSHDMTVHPEIRATIFPLVHLLYAPIRFFFSFIESPFLTAVYIIHKVFTWATHVVWFLFQMWMYSTAEQLIGSVLKVFDQVIMELLPGWVPPVLVSGTATMLGISGLKCYWYGISFWSCLKWMMICRFGVFLLIQAFLAVVTLVEAWRNGFRPKRS